MSKPRLLLRHGANTIDLNDQNRYFLAQNFVPPATAYAPQFAEGSSANQRNGGSFVSKRAANRSLSFTVALAGASASDIDQAARSVQMMLTGAGDSSDPVYLEYNSNSAVPEPLWGQLGVNLRYEIVYGEAQIADGYLVGVRRTEDINLGITLTLKPYALGRQQRITTATGGIIEDILGSASGIARGMIIPEATTNKFTNPVFGHSTWNNDWTNGGGLVVSQNTDMRFVAFGLSSAMIARVAVNAIWYQSINVGNTNAHTLSCYIKLIDGSAPSASNVVLYYGTTVTPTITAVGDGWYRLSVSVTGINAATNTGIAILTNGYSCYVDGFQIEEKSYATPLAFGDLLGGAWSGTAHASTSTRTAAACKISLADDTFNIGQGSVRIALRFGVDSTVPTGSIFLFDTRDAGHTTSYYARFNGSTKKFDFSDSTNTASSAAQTFAANTIYILHFIWSSAGLRVYVNGAADGTATLTIPASMGSSLFIGSSYASAGQFMGTFMGFATFDRVLTATEVALDYAEIAAMTADDARIESLPWFWTDDGDNILSLTTGKLPLGVTGGIPGSAPAITEIHGTLSSNWSVIKGIILGNFKSRRGTIKYSDVLFDCSGVVGGGDYGGGHANATATTTPASLDSSFTTSAIAADLLDGVEYYDVLRLKAASGTPFYIYNYYGISSATATVLSPAKLITPATSYRLFVTPQSHFALNTRRFIGATPPQVKFNIWAATTTSTLSVDLDYFAVLPRPVVILAGAESINGFVYRGALALAQGSTLIIGAPLSVMGDVFEFDPGVYNHVQCYFGADGTIDPVTTYTVTLAPMYVTPRYELL
jgi:hypothetical protein